MTGLCSRCRKEPRSSGHRWCLPCKRAYLKTKRDEHGWNYGHQSAEAIVRANNRSRAKMRRRRNPPAETPQCFVCATTDEIHHHHPNHDRLPDVTIPLCADHHRWIHRVASRVAQ